ncbi:hypothetical protein EVAR_20973_1 [Eumeta japonica]|uniref:Uncharacterized protein n=1 Tax=Eumeta variegata TaxID=151549 RepID=A0A4C1V6G6_EUMVA|nr:hypothetical protein EVAR_20973_1 [Eumeta japonica]
MIRTSKRSRSSFEIVVCSELPLCRCEGWPNTISARLHYDDSMLNRFNILRRQRSTGRCAGRGAPPTLLAMWHRRTAVG